LLQWNIWFKENIDNIINELKRIDADIVCIQELSTSINDNSNIEKLKKIYPYVHYGKADTFLDGRNQYNAILSKYPFLNCHNFFVQEPSLEKSDYSKEGRIYIEVELEINNQELIIGTTHLSYTHKFEETSLKDAEVNKLISYINKTKNYIFAGDLNTTKTSKYIKEIEKYLINHDTQNTWTTKPFSYQGFNENKLNWKLDYIFSTPDIKVINTQVIKTNYSDHLPIILYFEL
ncbi:MAG: endonuclease/exonuclease/phosphatase family protein, partial [Bacilli bacterium]|nr:endonuclease/exonuclease/phosphatase family protein [Bacilli bacterium]